MNDADADFFDDIVLTHSASTPVKALLANEIKRLLFEQGLSQTRAASRLGMSQADLSKLLSGKLPSCSFDRLMRILTQLGQTVTIQTGPALPHEPPEILFRSLPPWGRTTRKL